MADITWANVTDFDGSLTAVSSNAQTAILASVNAWLDVNVLDGESGPDTHLARIYLAAHHGLGALSGTSGIVASESGGDGLSVTYAVPTTATRSQLGETKWGRKYLELLSTSLARVWVVL